MEQLTMHIIANIHSDFPTKFGIPRQSGLVEELTSQNRLRARTIGHRKRCGGWRISPTSGSSGSFPRR